MSGYIAKCSIGTSEHILKEEIRNVLHKSGFYEKTLSLVIMDNKRDLDKFCFCWGIEHKHDTFQILRRNTNTSEINLPFDGFLIIPSNHIIYYEVQRYIKKVSREFDIVNLFIIDHKVVGDRKSKRSREIKRLSLNVNNTVVVTSLSMSMIELFFSINVIDKDFMYLHEFKNDHCNLIETHNRTFIDNKNPYKNKKEFYQQAEKYIKDRTIKEIIKCLTIKT